MTTILDIAATGCLIGAAYLVAPALGLAVTGIALLAVSWKANG